MAALVAGIPEPAAAATLPIVADRLEIADGRFDVAADLTPALDRHGPGIYTVWLWGRPHHLSDPIPLSEQSIFWQTAPPQGAPY